MDVYQAIIERRSIRRFKQQAVDPAVLERCVNAARLAPSANNRQRLEYIVVTEEPGLSEVFSCLSWAGYIKPKWDPAPGERPTAYIVIVADSPLKGHLGCDAGAAAENIALTAWESKIGTCILGSVREKEIRKPLAIPENRYPLLAIALGYSAEDAVAVDYQGSVEYWRDEQDRHCVPKKSLESIRHQKKYGQNSLADRE